MLKEIENYVDEVIKTSMISLKIDQSEFNKISKLQPRTTEIKVYEITFSKMGLMTDEDEDEDQTKR